MITRCTTMSCVYYCGGKETAVVVAARAMREWVRDHVRRVKRMPFGAAEKKSEFICRAASVPVSQWDGLHPRLASLLLGRVPYLPGHLVVYRQGHLAESGAGFRLSASVGFPVDVVPLGAPEVGVVESVAVVLGLCWVDGRHMGLSVAEVVGPVAVVGSNVTGSTCWGSRPVVGY